MPISRRHFDEGRTPALNERITSFLEAHPDQAYTAEDIARALKLPAARKIVGVDPDRHEAIRRSQGELRAALNLLSGNHQIAAKLIGHPGERDLYYSCRDPDEMSARPARPAR